MKLKGPHMLENLLLATMLDFPGAFGYYLRRLSAEDFKVTYNRTIFYAIKDMDPPINTMTVYQKLIESRMCLKGIVTHLAMLSGLGWMTDREDNIT